MFPNPKQKKREKDTFGLEKQDFHRYLQVRDYYYKKLQVKELQFEFYISCIPKKDNKKLVSRIYESIQASKNHSTLSIRQKWERERETQISKEIWMAICETQATTPNSRSLREFGWKNVVRLSCFLGLSENPVILERGGY